MRIARFILLFALAAGILAIPAPSQAQVAIGVSIRVGPPALPVYAQPICPGPGYIWTPGYWAYGPDGYFWVPGTWVLAPEPGFLWTPGYWGFADGVYVWHGGYWGPHVGFYGGINYGFGYTGVGFVGGYWRGGNYFYNRSVTNVNVTVIHNVYNKTVINEHIDNHVSFNGGPGGIHAEPNREERLAEHERHVSMTAEQNRHFEGARGDRRFLASENHGRPEVAATPRSGDFHGRGVEHGRADDRARPDDRGRSDRPPSSRHSGNPSSNPRLEQKHEQQFDKMQRQQDAERQKMQQRQNQEQQKLSRQNASQQRQDQLQRRQQQQKEQMNQKHQQQTQKLQQRQESEHQKEQSKPHGNANRP
jgi:WXXGXW repeat (2 copies)